MNANTIHRTLTRISRLPNGVILGLVAGLLLATQILSAAEARTNAVPPRVTVAVIPWRPLEPRTTAPEDRHWYSIFSGLVTSELRHIATLKVVPEDAVARELARQTRDEQDLDEPDKTDAAPGIQKLAESLQAPWVVCGFLTSTGATWTAQVYVMSAAPGSRGKKFRDTSTNWFELRDQVVRHVLQCMNITPSSEEQRRLGRPWTPSPQALEWASQGDSLDEHNFAQRAELFRKALAEDPQFVQARGLLAATLYNLGDEDEALVEARRALSQKPDAHLAGQLHLIIATVLALKEQSEGAARESAEGLRVSPENIQLLEMQASQYEHRGDLRGASDCLRRAMDYDPNNPALYASLGAMQSKQGDLTNALARLDHAAQLAADAPERDQLHLDQTLAEAYQTIGNLTNALRHYRRILSKGRDEGLPESRFSWVEETVCKLEQRSQPVPVTAGRPRNYSAPELESALRERLSAAELVLAVNPIACTTEMASWAGKIVAGTQGDLARARKLFDELASRPKAAGGETRTAQAIFAGWGDLSQSFCCQEYAKLYVALARSAGLPAFYVHVDRDYTGTVVDHDCAVVFADGKAWLVDPAYAWFGIPHREFRVLDDLQTIAHHAFQPHDGNVDASLCRTGLKLDPDFLWGRMCLVLALIESGKHGEAWQELEAARQQAPENWRGYQLEGMLAIKQDRLEEARKSLQKAEEANPADGDTRIMLAPVLFRSGQQAAARQELLAGLRRHHSSKNEEGARELLALLEAALGSGPTAPTTSKSPMDAASYCDLGTSCMSGSKPNYAEAVKWFGKAAEMGHPQAQCALGVLYWTGQGVPEDPAAAIGWFQKAAEGGSVGAMRNLGLAYGNGMGVKRSLDEGARWFRRAAQAGDAQSQMFIGRICYEGMGVPKNLTEALFWLILATEPRAETSAVVIGNRFNPREAQVLRKEVELFASPEEITAAKARLESHRAKQSPPSANPKPEPH